MRAKGTKNLAPERIAEIEARLLEGMTLREITSAMGHGVTTVSNIRVRLVAAGKIAGGAEARKLARKRALRETGAQHGFIVSDEEMVRIHALARKVAAYQVRRPWTKAENWALTTLVNAGWLFEEIAPLLNRSIGALKQQIHDIRYGLTSKYDERHASEAIRQKDEWEIAYLYGNLRYSDDDAVPKWEPRFNQQLARCALEGGIAL